MTLNDLIYRLVRPLGGLRVTKYLARRHPRVLMYHRLTGQPSAGAIDADAFRLQMRIIRKHFQPMSLDALIAAGTCGKVPVNAVAVTFDDGYQDFYDFAFPVLKEEGIPCTLFVTTGFVNGDIWLWPDQLRFCVDRSTEERIDLPGAASLPLADNRHLAWNVLADHCLRLCDSEKAGFIASTAQRLGVQLPAFPPPAFRGLNWNQVCEVAEEGVDIGSHSVTHPVMSGLAHSKLLYELTHSRQEIEDHIGRPASAFCYPNGQPLDFDEEVKAAVQEAGYEYALVAYPGAVPLGDRWAVNRYPASLSNGAFEKALFGFTYLRLTGGFLAYDRN